MSVALLFRELPFGARQQSSQAYIPSELCTEPLWAVGCTGRAR